MTKWVTISEASVILGVSERTIWRRIRDGLIDAEIDSGRRMVKIVNSTDNNGILVMPESDNSDAMEWLKNELSKREEQIEFLQEEIRQLRDRSDAIIIKLTEELEAQRCLFQGLKPEKKRDRSFWKLLGRSPDDDSSES